MLVLPASLLRVTMARRARGRAEGQFVDEVASAPIMARPVMTAMLMSVAVTVTATLALRALT